MVKAGRAEVLGVGCGGSLVSYINARRTKNVILIRICSRFIGNEMLINLVLCYVGSSVWVSGILGNYELFIMWLLIVVSI